MLEVEYRNNVTHYFRVVSFTYIIKFKRGKLRDDF